MQTILGDECSDFRAIQEVDCVYGLGHFDHQYCDGNWTIKVDGLLVIAQEKHQGSVSQSALFPGRSHRVMTQWIISGISSTC